MTSRFVLVVLALCAAVPSAFAVVGSARLASGGEARSIVMVLSSRGSFCTATAIARDLLLTAAHCVPSGFDYRLLERDGAGQPVLKPVGAITRHPSFNPAFTQRDRATADLALIKLEAPLPASVAVARLTPRADRVQRDEAVRIVGYGLAVPGDARSGGTARVADLVTVGTPSTFQIRLADPATKGAAPGLGACTGDSGAPAFQGGGVIGVVSWTTGANGQEGCGGLTGLTPLTSYHGWIVEAARKLGSPIQP
jgi:hypothetical protein